MSETTSNPPNPPPMSNYTEWPQEFLVGLSRMFSNNKPFLTVVRTPTDFYFRELLPGTDYAIFGATGQLCIHSTCRYDWHNGWEGLSVRETIKG